MLTLKLKIKNCDNLDYISKKQQDYSFAFRKLYSNYSKINDKTFLNLISKKYDLDSWFIQCLKIEVEMKRTQDKIFKEQNIQNQKEIENKLLSLISNKDKKSKRIKYKLLKKLKSLEKSLSKNIVFGSKILLQRISFLSNDKEKNKKEIEKLKSEYQQKRILPISIIGESPYKGNRKFNFDLQNKKIIFKPNKKIKINLEFYCSNKQQIILNKIQELSSKKDISISVKLSTDYIYLCYDEEKLNGFAFNLNDYKKVIKNIKSKKERNPIYKQFCEEQKQRKLKGKIENRYLAVDLNPQYIGWSICDKTNNEIKVIDKGCYDLSRLSTKLKLSSTNPKQIYQNNKRKFEISNIWKDLFEKATHYKVANFVIEELNFKSNVINESAKERNRKCKNIWHRSLTTNLISKYCNSLGIEKIEINPCYSSFIGNIQNNFFDPTNASLEICRRGVFKFEKGKFYPIVTKLDFDTMSNLIQVSDVQNKTELLETLKSLSSWRDFFTFFKQIKLKYRRSLEEIIFKEFSFNNKKSLTTFYCF